MHDELRDAAASQLFTKSPAPYLLLTPDLTIFGVNDAYLTRTLRDREDLVGRDMFEAFPDNPADPEANGVANLAGSLGRVLSTRRPDRMPLQRYDIPVPRMGGRFIRKTWTVLNSGLFDERNKVVGLLHHVEDVTSCAPEADLQVDRLSPHSLEALVHGLTACASRYRAALQELGLHDLRVTDALATLVARHGVDARREAQRRRRALWQDVVAEYRAAPSADWLESVCRQTSRVVDPTWSAAVSAFDSAGNPYVLAGSDGWARQLESLQEMVGEGPGVTARTTRLPVTVPDLRHQGRWLAFSGLAVEAGAAAVVAIPVSWDGVVVGAMSFFGRSPQQWERTQWRDASLLADLAGSAMIADAEEYYATSDGAYQHRDLMAMAAGMLSVQLSIPASQASAALRAYAFAQGTHLEEAARAVVEGRLRLA